MDEKFKYLYIKLFGLYDGGAPIFENIEAYDVDKIKLNMRNQISDLITDLSAAAYERAIYDISRLPEVEIHIKQ